MLVSTCLCIACGRSWALFSSICIGVRLTSRVSLMRSALVMVSVLLCYIILSMNCQLISCDLLLFGYNSLC